MCKNSVCEQQDDRNVIGQKMLEADAIVVGVPDYEGIINGLAQDCLEGTFCFRRQDKFNVR